MDSASSFKITSRTIEIVREEVRAYHYLPGNLQTKLLERTSEILRNITFRPGGALEEVNERMKLSISGQASLLLLGHKQTFPTVKQIVVFPGRMIRASIAGEAYTSGEIHVAWESSKQGGQLPFDGFNLVIHEFAHHLDFEDYVNFGVPVPKGSCDTKRWVACIGSEHSRLIAGVKTELFDSLRKHPQGESKLELFAYSVEHFFERPRCLTDMHPELFSLLVEYFGFDPLIFYSGRR